MITVTERAAVALGFSFGSPLGAVQIVRQIVMDDEFTKVLAGRGVDLINKLLGTSITYGDFIAGIAPKLHADWELMVAQAVAEAVVRAEGEAVDEVLLLEAAKTRVLKLMNSPQHSWMFAKPDVTAASGEGVKVIEDVNVTVEVKANGKLKKGGAGALAEELYRVRVLNSNEPVTNGAFIDMLVNEVGMTKSGATTYAYNIDKKLGPKLVKKQRGA
jgi:hypothetical protein